MGPPTRGGRGGKGNGKGKGTRFAKIMEKSFQVMLGGQWKDYDKSEDENIKKAFLVGHPHAQYSLRGQSYKYDFQQLKQINLDSGKERQIRAPPGMSQPKSPLVPPGPMIIIQVPNTPGTKMEISDPANKGSTITVAIPPGSKPGQKMAVPVPAGGEKVEDVVKRQRGWSTGAKVAAGAAGVGALAVGGVILGEHLSDGAVSDWFDDAGAGDVGDAVEAATDWTEGAAEDVADWTTEAAADTADWVEGAVDDIGEWAPDAMEDAGAWLGDAGEDAGDLIMSLF